MPAKDSASATQAQEPLDESAPPDRKKPRKNKTGTAAAMLRKIPSRHESARAPYTRDYFGGWLSTSGCTTRQRVLQKESTRGRPSGCSVRRGLWFSAYDGERVRDASALDVDHLVPLAEAWRSGASRWSAGTRIRYANDLGYSGTLRAVTAGSNRAKGDQDPANWMPPRQIHHCKYIGTWIAVKYRWRLAVDRAERRVLAQNVRDCRRKADVPKPARAVVRISKRPIGSVAPKRNRSRSTPRRGLSGGRADRRYDTCAAAKANGLGPYRRGADPEYGWYRDADGDGLVCE